jgi:hypothetical protein
VETKQNKKKAHKKRPVFESLHVSKIVCAEIKDTQSHAGSHPPDINQPNLLNPTKASFMYG